MPMPHAMDFPLHIGKANEWQVWGRLSQRSRVTMVTSSSTEANVPEAPTGPINYMTTSSTQYATSPNNTCCNCILRDEIRIRVEKMKEIIEKVNDAMKKSIKNFQQETSEQIGREIANLRENIVKDVSLDLLEKIQTQNEPTVYMTSDKSLPKREEKAEEADNDPSSPDDGLKGDGSESEPEIPLPEDDKDYE